MTKKEKLILSTIMMLLLSLFNLFFTAALHGLLSGTYQTLTLVPLGTCAAGLFDQKQQALLFLSFEGFALLCITLFVVQNQRTYQSDFRQITDEIKTPAPAGQLQHGSARWLGEKEKETVFACFTLHPESREFAGLIRSGYDNLDFLKPNRKEVLTDTAGPEEKKETKNLPGADCTELMVLPPVSEKVLPKKDNGKETDGDFEEVEYRYPAADAVETPETDEAIAAAWEIQEPEIHRLIRESGLVIGMKKEKGKERIYFLTDDTHSITIGATRSGKTRTIVIQSICMLGLAGESLIISDPKAELYHYTCEFLVKLGYEVLCIDFKNPEKSSRYNLLQPVIDAVNCDDMEKAEMYAWDVTNVLVGDNVSNEKVWENGEKSTIAAAILCVVVDNKDRPEFQNLTNVYWFVAEMCKTVGSKTPMQEYVKKLSPNHPARALLSISDVAPSRTKGSFYTSALTTLRLFTSKSVYSITKESDCDLADIGRKKMALFFVLPDEKTTYYPIASLMISQLYEMLVRQSDERGGRLLNRVNFMLDEFGNFTKINDFTNKLTVAGGRGMRFNLFLQSFEQLTEKYNKETAAIVKSNCQTWVYLQADDRETLQDICEKLGKYTTSAYQLSGQHGKYVNPSTSHSISLIGRELLTTDEIRRVARPYQIVVSRAHPAMMESPDLSQWYFNRMLGLGDKEHNRKVREERERKRLVRVAKKEEIQLWNIWIYYTKDIQIKEMRQRQKAMTGQPGSLFSGKLVKQGGQPNENEDED